MADCDDMDKCLAKCACGACVYGGGPVAMLVGLMFLHSASVDRRAEQMAQLRPVVAAWSNGGRAEFEGRQYSIAINGGPDVPLLPDEWQNWHLTDLDPGELPAWSPLRYSTTANVSGFAQLTVALSDRTPHGTSSTRRDTTTLPTSPPIQVCEIVGKETAGRRLEDYGQGNGGPPPPPPPPPPPEFRELAAVHVVVDPTSRLDAQLVTDEYRTRSRYSAANTVSACRRDRLEHVEFTVRSNADPYILAGELTDFSFVFAFGSGVYAAAGTFALILGLCCTFCVYGRFCSKDLKACQASVAGFLCCEQQTTLLPAGPTSEGAEGAEAASGLEAQADATHNPAAGDGIYAQNKPNEAL